MRVEIKPPLRLDFVWGSTNMWDLVQPLLYGIDSRFSEVEAGFRTDLASVPSMFQGVYPPAGPYAPAAVVHDWLYREQLRHGFTREQVDQIFREGAITCGTHKHDAEILFQAVRAGGAHSWQMYRKALGLPRSPEPWDSKPELPSNLP